MKKTIAFILPILALAFILFYNSKNNTNNRMNPNTQSANFSSRLQNESRENLETLTEPLTEVKTKIIDVSTDENTRAVEAGDKIRVNYVGWLASDGSIFDQSFNHGSDGFVFTVGSGVIEGWSEGTVGMKLGEVKRLYIPSEKGYGDQDNGSIPANSDLIFDVELISFED